MNGKIFIKTLRSLPLVLTALAVLAVPSFGATVSLVADSFNITMPGGEVIPMWGYFEDTGQACGTEPAWTGGYQIIVPAGDTILDVTLRNCLAEETSLIITGQVLPEAPVPVPGTNRVRSFTTEVAPGGTHIYSFTDLKPGTYLYKSGTHPAKQVQMGLYGVMVADTAANEAYGIPYVQDLILLYSEIDPALHKNLTTGLEEAKVAKPLTYRPKYFLVNGTPFVSGSSMPIGPLQQPTLLRFANAGLKDHAPTISAGYLSVVAEDGNAYPYPHEQYSMILAAGKTMDAILVPQDGEQYTVYDRSLHLTNNGVTGGGLMTPLVVTGTGGPVAVAGPDQTGVMVGSVVQLDGSGSSAGVTSYSWSIVSVPPDSTLTVLDTTTPASPTFTADVAGTYTFELIVNDGTADSLADQVQVTAVNMPPVANAGPDQDVTAGDIVTLAGSASDPDNYPGPLTYSWSLTSVPAGSTAALSDVAILGPTFTADLAGTYVAELTVSDGDINSIDSVTITATDATSSNIPPIAWNDFATTIRNTDVVINILANDYDDDGSIDATSVMIVTNPTQGGSVSVNPDGTVTFSPKRGFRGTDTFTYQVSDNLAAVSNVATVRVNVVKH